MVETRIKQVHYLEQICDYVCDHAQEGDLVITLGCGDAYKIAKMVLKKLSEEK